jgi:hypothetical protein
VLESDVAGEQYPSKLIRPVDGKLIWLIDRAAASQLTDRNEKQSGPGHPKV